MNTPALLIADEVARYVSQDCERALAELRKYRVGLVLGFQTYGMLGQPGEPIRDAIEKVPATRLVFRLNSMQETTVLAAEVVKLNFEMPVEVLKAPAVVRHELRRMRNANRGGNTPRTRQGSITKTAGSSSTETEEENGVTNHRLGITEQQSHTLRRTRPGRNERSASYVLLTTP
jgi:hypothetical protein